MVDEETFFLLKHIKKEKTSKTTSTEYVHIFSGLGLLKCGKCGSNMHAFTHKKHTMRYICGKGQAGMGCKGWSFNAGWLEDTVIRLAANHVFIPKDFDDDCELKIKALLQKKSYLEEQISRLEQAILVSRHPESLSFKRDNLIDDLKDVDEAIASSMYQKQSRSRAAVEWGLIDSNVLLLEEHDLRILFQDLVKKSVESIYCYQIKQRQIRFQLNFINGKSITAVRTPNTLVFDGGAWVKMSEDYGELVEEEYDAGLFPESENDIPAWEIDREELKKSIIEDGLEWHESFGKPPEGVVGDYNGYEYNGFLNFTSEAIKNLDCKSLGDEIKRDIRRLNHLVSWADGMKGTPEIIEDQYQVYKHPRKKLVVKKPKPSIYFIDGLEFKSEIKAPWQN